MKAIVCIAIIVISSISSFYLGKHVASDRLFINWRMVGEDLVNKTETYAIYAGFVSDGRPIEGVLITCKKAGLQIDRKTYMYQNR